MIELTVLNYLLGQDLSVGSDIYLEVPKDPPEEYVIIEKTGSGKSNLVCQAMIAFQSYSKNSLYNAATLNEEIKASVEAMPDTETNVFKADLNSDYNYTNPATKEYRYQAVFNVIYQE